MEIVGVIVVLYDSVGRNSGMVCWDWQKLVVMKSITRNIIMLKVILEFRNNLKVIHYTPLQQCISRIYMQ